MHDVMLASKFVINLLSPVKNNFDMAGPMAAPVISFAIGQITLLKNRILSLIPIVFNIVPINKDAKVLLPLPPVHQSNIFEQKFQYPFSLKKLLNYYPISSACSSNDLINKILPISTFYKII